MYLETQQHLQNSPGKSNINRTHTAVHFFVRRTTQHVLSWWLYQGFPNSPTEEVHSVYNYPVQLLHLFWYSGALHSLTGRTLPTSHSLHPLKVYCCCFKVKMQSLLGQFWPPLSRFKCFTTYKLLYYFSATREQCSSQQDVAAGLEWWSSWGKQLCTDIIFLSSTAYFFPLENRQKVLWYLTKHKRIPIH